MTKMTELTVLELEQEIDNCPALVNFGLYCYEVDAGIVAIASARHYYRRLVSMQDFEWILKYWDSNGVYGDLPVDAPISALSMMQFQYLSERVEQEAQREDALPLPKAKKRKAKLSNEEKIALMWLRLPRGEEELWGIARLESGGFVAHTDWSGLYFQTMSHAIAFLTVWANDGFRPALSNLRVGNKPMAFNREKHSLIAKATRATMIMDADKAFRSVPELTALGLTFKLHFEGIESAITLATVRSSLHDVRFTMSLPTLMSVLGGWSKNGVCARVGVGKKGFASECAFEKWVISVLGALKV